MLRAARRVNDLTSRKSDTVTERKQEIRVVSHRGFGLRFGLDHRIAARMAERVARAKGRGRVIDIKNRMHHRAMRLEQPIGLLQIVFQLGLQKMGEQRIGKHQIERPVRFWNPIGMRPAGLIVGHAGVAGLMKAKALAVVISPAPIDRFTVDIDANIGAGEAPTTKIIIPQPVRPAPATDADIDDIGIHADDVLAEYKHPEIARVNQEMTLIVENTIADAGADAQVIGRQRAKLREYEPRNDVECIHRPSEQRVECEP